MISTVCLVSFFGPRGGAVLVRIAYVKVPDYKGVFLLSQKTAKYRREEGTMFGHAPTPRYETGSQKSFLFTNTCHVLHWRIKAR